MQRGSGCKEDQDETRIKMQQGSRCNEDQDAMRVKMQRGLRRNKGQDATRIFNAPFTPFSIALRSCGPNSSTCVLVLFGELQVKTPTDKPEGDESCENLKKWKPHKVGTLQTGTSGTSTS